MGQEILTLDIRGLIVSNHVGSIYVAGILLILEMPSNSVKGTVKQIRLAVGCLFKTHSRHRSLKFLQALGCKRKGKEAALPAAER